MQPYWQLYTSTASQNTSLKSWKLKEQFKEKVTIIIFMKV